MNRNSDIAKYKDMLICGEVTHTKISTVTTELLRTGRELCDRLGESLHVLLVGKDIEEAASKAIALGADKVHLASGVSLEESSPEFYIQVISRVCVQLQPLFFS